MSTGRNPDLNMLLRHCSWKIMEFLIFGVRDLWDFIPKCEILFKIWDFIHETLNFDSNDHQHNYNQIWFHCQPGGTQAKKIAETLLFGWVVAFLVCGDVRFYSWCEILFRNAGFYSWKPSISTQIITEHNEKCIVSYCTTAAATIKYVSRGILALKYCRYTAFWMIMGF